jgi:hypothetical protein
MRNHPNEIKVSVKRMRYQELQVISIEWFLMYIHVTVPTVSLLLNS